VTQIIDSHVHIYGPPDDAEPAAFVELMRRYGIERSVAFRKVYGKPTMVGNEAIREAVERFPNELVGVVWVDAADPGACAEIDMAVTDWGFQGVKLHLEMEEPPAMAVRAACETAAGLDVPVIIHVGEEFDDLFPIAAETGATIVIAHLGTGVYNLVPQRLERAVELAEANDNVFLETSGNVFYFIERAVGRLGPERVLFGSDFPHEHPAVAARAVEILDVSDAGKRLILRENARRLFHLDG